MSKKKLPEVASVVVDEGFDLPQYAHEGDAGFDLITNQDILVRGRAGTLVSTPYKIALPAGHVLLVCSKSGLAAKEQIFVLNAPGIVDSGYRGTIGVPLYNLSLRDRLFKKGDKVAQGVIVKYEKLDFLEVDELDVTDRNEGGFGSTGQ
jgi:dUTP pyrophosphatase